MSTTAVSSTSLNPQVQQYFQTRSTDLKQLGQALSNGDLAGAQTAYNKIAALGQNGPFPNGNPFLINQRDQAFTQIGQALQSGDLASAQHAFSALRDSFTHGNRQLDPTSANSNSPSSSGPEIVLNLSSGTTGAASPEQITINISNPASGGEQVSLSVGSQGSNAQQVTFNLPSNSNEQIVLNLLGASSTGGSSGTSTTSGPSAGGGISVSA